MSSAVSLLDTATLWLALGSFLITVALLWCWLNYTAGSALVALPNARSSHSQPTPTGGGIAIVVVLTFVLLGYFWLGVGWAGWLAGGGLVIALLGLADDLVELSAPVRIVIQWMVVAAVVWALGAVDTLGADPAGGVISGLPSYALWLLLLLGLTWFINLFNFMDGIDGIATAQSGAYCLGALLFMLGDAGWASQILWVGFAASVGFAVFNAAPARIFMGDAGSAFWGYLIGLLALHLALVGALPFVASLVLLSAFWFDASYTLCVRMVTGQKFAQGHRSHLYQRLADRFGHGRTTVMYVALFLLWQWPLVWWGRALYLAEVATTEGHDWALLDLRLWWLVVLACLPVLVGCVVLRAGQSHRIEAPTK